MRDRVVLTAAGVSAALALGGGLSIAAANGVLAAGPFGGSSAGVEAPSMENAGLARPLAPAAASTKATPAVVIPPSPTWAPAADADVVPLPDAAAAVPGPAPQARP